jgi:hypothetical protein
MKILSRFFADTKEYHSTIPECLSRFCAHFEEKKKEKGGSVPTPKNLISPKASLTSPKAPPGKLGSGAPPSPVAVKARPVRRASIVSAKEIMAAKSDQPEKAVGEKKDKRVSVAIVARRLSIAGAKAAKLEVPK